MTDAPVRVGIIADYSGSNRYHVATDQSLAHAAMNLGVRVETRWLDTDSLTATSAEALLLDPCDALWAGPSSPYRSMEGALRAIRFARERLRPLVGT